MPKGVYDRNKMRNKKEMGADSSTSGVTVKAPKVKKATGAVVEIHDPYKNAWLLHEVRENLNVLLNAKGTFNNVDIQKDIHNNLDLMRALTAHITAEFSAGVDTKTTPVTTVVVPNVKQSEPAYVPAPTSH